MRAVGLKIMYKRKEHNMKQTELAALMKVHSVTISRWEKNGLVSVAELEKLGKIFDVKPSYFLED